MLNEKQIKSINLLISGEYQIQEIAEAVGVSRQTLHTWRTENEEYKEEYEKRLQETTKALSQKFNERLDTAIESLYDIITNPDVATRERKDACIYWINRVMGTPTNKTEMLDDNKDNNKVSDTDILDAIDEVQEEDKDDNDNVIDIKKAK